jgi:hypothetical protein
MRSPLLVSMIISLALLLTACGESNEAASTGAATGDLFEDAVASAALADGEPVDLGASLASMDLSAAAEEDIEFAAPGVPEYAVDCRLDAFRERVLSLYDADGSGRLDGAERDALRADFAPHPDRRRAEARFHRVRRLKWVYDVDASGDLDADELDQLRLGLEQRCMHREAWLLDAFDEDESGDLDASEWDAAREDLGARLDERWSAFLERYDLDESGDLDEAERAAAEADRLEQILALHVEMVLKHDANGDGRLDSSERDALREALATEVRSDELLDRIEPDPPPPPPPPPPPDDDDDEPCRPFWHPKCRRG